MDSLDVMDHASEFGRGIDLDRVFPGFPTNDVEGFGRRGSDIRSHLDDLASRHPEFADHLSDSAWGDILGFHKTGSLKNRRRRGSGGTSAYQGNPDEDARSQTSGSSGASAASGASGVSSRGEPSSSNVFYRDKHQRDPPSRRDNENDTTDWPGTRRNPIPQYGFRNTVDIGQQRHEMENDERSSDNRGQRSMSAPPENRQQNDAIFREKPTEQPQNTNQRFVSRVDITPQFGQSAAASTATEKSNSKPQQAPSGHQPQKTPQQQSNVRHIPIFVEGRDEPVVSKNLTDDQTDSTGWPHARPQRTESPPHYQHNSPFGTPPQFHRPSHFDQPFRGGRPRDWLPNFEEEIYSPQGASVHQPGVRKHHQQPFTSPSPPPRQAHYRQAQPETRASQRSYEPSHFHQQPHPATTPQQHQPQQQQPQEAAAAAAAAAAAPAQPRAQTQPKDPLEKVADVQQEVDSLHQQVKRWNGKSRKDKDYMYLDEMLTRELIKLDDIETEGKENVRQARKNAIKSIQNSISLLESKAPLNDEKLAEGTMDVRQESLETSDHAEKTESVAVDEENNAESKSGGQASEERQAASLPVVPSSPTKEPIAALPEVDESMQAADAAPRENENTAVERTPGQRDNVEMDVATPVAEASSTGSMEMQTSAETEQSRTTAPEATPAIAVPETGMEVVENPKSPRTTKKCRKTKKPQEQAPISDGAIPLPAPETHETNIAK